MIIILDSLEVILGCVSQKYFFGLIDFNSVKYDLPFSSMNFVFLLIIFLVIFIIFSIEAKARAVTQSTLRSDISDIDLTYNFPKKEIFLEISQLSEGFYNL